MDECTSLRMIMARIIPGKRIITHSQWPEWTDVQWLVWESTISYIYAESIQQKICIKKFTNFASFVTSILKQNMSCFFFFVCVGGGEIMTPKRLSVNDVQGSGNTIKCTCISTSLTISFLLLQQLYFFYLLRNTRKQYCWCIYLCIN